MEVFPSFSLNIPTFLSISQQTPVKWGQPMKCLYLHTPPCNVASRCQYRRRGVGSIFRLEGHQKCKPRIESRSRYLVTKWKYKIKNMLISIRPPPPVSHRLRVQNVVTSCETRMPATVTMMNQVHKVIDPGVIWKGFMSWVSIPHMKFLYLTVQNLYGHG